MLCSEMLLLLVLLLLLFAHDDVVELSLGHGNSGTFFSLCGTRRPPTGRRGVRRDGTPKNNQLEPLEAHELFYISPPTETGRGLENGEYVGRPLSCPDNRPVEKIMLLMDAPPFLVVFVFLPQQQQQQQGQKTATPLAVRILCDAADKLRPLGNHPALPAVLRHTAREWVRSWAKSPAAAGAAGAGASTALSSSSASSSKAHNNRGHDHVSPQRPTVSCLEEAAKCLAEAREVLSTLAAEAEPTGDALSSPPPLVAAETPPANTEDEVEPAGAKKGKGAADNKGGKKAAEGKSKSGAAASSPPADSADATPADEPATQAVAGSVSTPLGRCLTMVQLEEACVRLMLGRAKGDGHSSTKAAEAAANREGVTPVQKCADSFGLGTDTPHDIRFVALREDVTCFCRCSRKSKTPPYRPCQ